MEVRLQTHQWPPLLVAAVLAGCPSPSRPEVQVRLQPITQLHQRFETPRGPGRTDFYVTDWPARPGDDARASLAAQLRAIPPPAGADWAVRSIYVYRRGPGLDEHTQVEAIDLRGSHLRDVVAFARWTDGQLDLMDAVEEGMVVFDLLRREPVDPPWEFR